MQSSTKSVTLAALIGLVVGLLLGFIPAHLSNSSLQDQNASTLKQKQETQEQLNVARNRLILSNFAVRAGLIEAQADATNYSLAGSSASSLFTDLRKYVDGTANTSIKGQIVEVLAARDQTIGELAQANPAVKQLLQEIFAKLQAISASADQNG